MLSLRKVAVTGGIASGKSTVCQLLKEFGAYTVSADQIVHQLLSPHQAVGQEVIQLMGSDIVVDGQIDRSRIAAIVFKNGALLKALEEKIHPAVFQTIEQGYKAVLTEGRYPLFVYEMPLLYETKSESFADSVITVVVEREESIRRFQQATGLTREEYERREAFQLPVEEKVRRADYVVQNNGSLEELKACLWTIFCKEGV